MTDPVTGIVYWEIAFWKSCEFKFDRVVDKVDLFMVGPGNNGRRGSYSNYGVTSSGGKGGDGGEIRNYSGVPIRQGVTYTVTLGSPGDDGYISANDSHHTTVNIGQGYSSSGGARKAGGAGATNSDDQTKQNASNGVDGVLSFGGRYNGVNDALEYERRHIWCGVYFGASGGGGVGCSQNGTGVTAGRGSGGRSAAGNGGGAGEAGQAAAEGETKKNHGAGGGGGGTYGTTIKNGGAGCPGILMIRNAR